MASMLVDPWPENLTFLREDFDQIAKHISPSTLRFPFWQHGPTIHQFKIEQKCLLGTSLAHRFLQQLLSVMPNVNLLNYEHLRWEHAVSQLSSEEYEFRNKQLCDALLSDEDPLLFVAFEVEMNKWAAALQKLVREKDFKLKL
jgi:hypothetical protein